MGELIAIVSGKGGTGKTSLCAGIAQALAESGEQVLCIDCDVGMRNLDIALGISQMGALSFQEVREYGLDKATQHPDFPNLRFLTAPMNCSAAAVDTEDFGRLLEEARSGYSYVLLDAPAGVEAGFRLAARYADRILVVTGSDPASVRDAGRAGQLLQKMDKQSVRIIVNRIDPKMVKAMKLTVDDIMDRTGLPLMGIVPEDPEVVLAAAFEKPLLKQTKKGAAAACRRIANRIQGRRVPVSLYYTQQGVTTVNIAFLAHDKKKELMVQFCTAYKSVLNKHNLFATATTGRLIADHTGLPITLLLSHKQGGHQQINARIAYNEIDLVLLFTDPNNTDPWDDNQMIETIRHCDKHNVPIATNLGSAEMFVMGLQRGDLDWREMYHTKTKY